MGIFKNLFKIKNSITEEQIDSLSLEEFVEYCSKKHAFRRKIGTNNDKKLFLQSDGNYAIHVNQRSGYECVIPNFSKDFLKELSEEINKI